MADSPTVRTLKHMRNQGFVCSVVEKHNTFSHKKTDLYGFIDVLCIRENEIVGVQTTSGGHVNDRIRKILNDCEYYPIVKKSGMRIEVHGWRKLQKKRGGKQMVWKPIIKNL